MTGQPVGCILGAMNHKAKLAQALILDSVGSILQSRIDSANGIMQDPDISVQDQDLIIDLARPMIQREALASKVGFENTKDVLALLKQGAITFSEAKELMELLKLQQDIDVMPELVEALSNAT